MQSPKIIFIFLIILITTPLMAASNMNNTIIRIPLLTAHLMQEKSLERVEIKRINFVPLQATGIHLHPCPVVGYIAKGTIYFQIAGEQPKTLHEGDAFFEPANTTILHFDNLSKTEPAIFIAFYLLSKNDHELIRMLPDKI